ncbi:MAG: hypothetical protein D6743_02160 [Calditrichaeota bacterium]|nr:MAG: hypothetical protein D6743_02160 [Calditrichota bacterium]
MFVNHKLSISLSFSLSLFAIFGAVQAFAQDAERPVLLNQASQYFLGDKDEILMNVNIWGYVKKPGQYMVPRNTDLITLISFAGGPREGAALNKVQIIREGIEGAAGLDGHDGHDGHNGHDGADGFDGVNGHDAHKPILTVNVAKHIETGRSDIIPILRAGDTVIVTQSFGHKMQRFFGFNSIFSVIAATASLALIVDRISR